MSNLRMCVTCGKMGGVCRWTDDAQACMRRQLHAMREALEQAQSCILGETPEYGSHEEARQDTLEKVRSVLK
jgi:DNA-binding FrmR family transcriptional regulator